MNTRDEEVVEFELAEALGEFGFTEYEAHTLIALTRLGTGTAKDIARADDVPRTRVYDAVEVLHDRGLVDVQHTTPRKFTVISRESIVRKLNADREDRITQIGGLFEELGPIEPQQEQLGVWTVTGHETVAQRVLEFIEDAEERIVYMTVDELLTEEHLDGLADASARGVTIWLAGISDPVQHRIQEEVPDAELFETLWEWSDTPAGSLLITDESTALVSVRVDGHEGPTIEETAIWGSGERNSLVVVLRAIFTWRLEDHDLRPGDDP